MSAIVISGDTSGAITLQAPAVSGNTTLNLPASSGTVLTQNSSAPANSFVVDASGNVGIGTSNPTSPLVLYRNSATSVSINLGNSVNSWLSGIDSSGNFSNYTNGAYNYIISTSGSERMRIDSSGNVGIGTNNPATKLDIRGGNGTGGISGSGGTWAAQVIMNQDSTGQAGLSVQTRRASSDTPIFQAAKGWNGTATGYYPVFSVYGDGTFSAGIKDLQPQYPAFFTRVFVNFNGTGTVSIRSSGNVSSITDNGVGTYTINFTTAMPDTNYCTVTGCSESAGAGNLKNSGARPSSTSAVVVVTGDNNTDTIQDFDNVNVTVFR